MKMKKSNEITNNALEILSIAIEHLQVLENVSIRDNGKVAPDYIAEKVRRAKHALEQFEIATDHIK